MPDTKSLILECPYPELNLDTQSQVLERLRWEVHLSLEIQDQVFKGKPKLHIKYQMNKHVEMVSQQIQKKSSFIFKHKNILNMK